MRKLGTFHNACNAALVNLIRYHTAAVHVWKWSTKYIEVTEFKNCANNVM